MADTNTTSTLDGLFKEVYADKLETLLPENVRLLKMVPFTERTRIGDSYHQPVILSNSHGVTYAANGAGAFTLNAPIVTTVKDAIVDGSQMVLREYIDLESASKAASAGPKAFKNATSLVVYNMMESMAKRVEHAMLYGLDGVGISDGSTNASSTSTVIDITTASWAAGTWAGAEGAQIDVYSVAATPAKQNAAAMTITAVDVANKTITVSGTTADVAAVDSYLGGTGSPTATIYWFGSYGAEMAGLNQIITNTGTLFGISAASFALWKGNSYNVSGAITLAKLDAAVATAVGRGLDERAIVLVSPPTWSNLNTDAAARKRYKTEDRRSAEGFESLVYYSSNGTLEVVPHNMVREGEGFIVPAAQVKRIGATDITFRRPGVEEGRFFKDLEDKAGYELRCYTHQSVFLQKPARAVKLTGIVNT